MFGAGEAGDVADLERDDGAEDLADAGRGLEAFDDGVGRDRLANSGFEFFDMGVELIQCEQLLGDHGVGVRRQVLPDGVARQELPTGFSKQVADAGVEDAVAFQRGVDAVLEHRAMVAQRHAGAEDLALIAEVARRNPDFGERAVAEKDGETFGVQGAVLLVRLVICLAMWGCAR